MKNGYETIKFKVQREEIPDSHLGGPRKYEWPFATMKVGECFYFPLKGGDGVRQVYGARATIMMAAREYRASGLRFATRHIREKRAIGVWRIK